MALTVGDAVTWITSLLSTRDGPSHPALTSVLGGGGDLVGRMVAPDSVTVANQAGSGSAVLVRRCPGAVAREAGAVAAWNAAAASPVVPFALAAPAVMAADAARDLIASQRLLRHVPLAGDLAIGHVKAGIGGMLGRLVACGAVARPVATEAMLHAVAGADTFTRNGHEGDHPLVYGWACHLHTDPEVRCVVEEVRRRAGTMSDGLIHGGLHAGTVWMGPAVRDLTAAAQSSPPASVVGALERRISATGDAGDDGAAGVAESKDEPPIGAGPATPTLLRGGSRDAAASMLPALDGSVVAYDWTRSGVGWTALDVGGVLGSLLTCVFTFRAHIREQEAIMARGGYAKFSAEVTRTRWAGNLTALVAEGERMWRVYCTAVLQHAASTAPATPLRVAAAALADTWVWASRIAGLHVVGNALGCGAAAAGSASPFTKVDAPLARVGAQVRAVAFGEAAALHGAMWASQAVAAGAGVPAHVPVRAWQDEVAALEPLLGAAARLFAYAARVDGDAAWPPAVPSSGGPAACAGSHYLGGRSAAGHVVLLAPCPLPWRPADSTLPSAPVLDTWGAVAGGPKAPPQQPQLRRVYAAMVADLLERLTPQDDGHPLARVRHTWRFTPAAGVLARPLQEWLESPPGSDTIGAGGASGGGAVSAAAPVGGLGPVAARQWALVSADAAGTHTRVGSHIEEAVLAAAADTWGPVALLAGVRVPHLTAEAVAHALSLAADGDVAVVPASDGTAAVTAWPAHVVHDAGALHAIVSAVEWGSPTEAATLVAAVREVCGDGQGVRFLARDGVWHCVDGMAALALLAAAHPDMGGGGGGTDGPAGAPAGILEWKMGGGGAGDARGPAARGANIAAVGQVGQRVRACVRA
jgi:hypothetical protein